MLFLPTSFAVFDFSWSVYILYLCNKDWFALIFNLGELGKSAKAPITWAVWASLKGAFGCFGKAHSCGYICPVGPDCFKSGKVLAKKALGKARIVPLEPSGATTPAIWMAGLGKLRVSPRKSSYLHERGRPFRRYSPCLFGPLWHRIDFETAWWSQPNCPSNSTHHILPCSLHVSNEKGSSLQILLVTLNQTTFNIYLFSLVGMG